MMRYIIIADVLADLAIFGKAAATILTLAGDVPSIDCSSGNKWNQLEFSLKDSFELTIAWLNSFAVPCTHRHSLN